ncbi:venom serine protease inhibitor-like [Aricia agestis]|uniref:venom serine protease inhibitor-like n=1 Tax=Aricia agestis TaxID=91739 RepID=UPI001C207462|nr:venom serine protease inhibitor-like [Aricia agestis]
MIKSQCPSEEVYRSCAFYEEYFCWTSANRTNRVYRVPKKLGLCRPGCYCKQGFVRSYPGGACIALRRCMSYRARAVLERREEHARTRYYKVTRNFRVDE